MIVFFPFLNFNITAWSTVCQEFLLNCFHRDNLKYSLAYANCFCSSFCNSFPDKNKLFCIIASTNKYEMLWLSSWSMMVPEHGSNSSKWNAFEMKPAGQTHALKNEAERLKQMSARHRRSRSVTSCYDPSSFRADASAVNWQMPDMARLNLNGSSVSPRGGYGLWQQPALTPLRR